MRVQPWLNFVNLLPFDSEIEPPDTASKEIMSALFNAGARPHEKDGVVLIAISTTAERPHLRAHYSLFYAVRRIFIEITDRCARAEGRKWSPGSFEPIRLQAVGSMLLDVGETGHIRVRRDRALEALTECLDGVAVERIRRCPECGCFYYASPKNKSACDRHLNLMRVNRTRGKRGRFEEHRHSQRTGLKRLSRKESKKVRELFQVLSPQYDDADSGDLERKK